jgi:hypothetical protein
MGVAILQIFEALKHALTFKCQPIFLEINDNILVGFIKEENFFLNIKEIILIRRLISRF